MTVLTEIQKRQWAVLLEAKGNEPFRRQDLAELLFPLTRPRSRPAADKLASEMIRRAAAAGEVERVGHLHWKAVGSTRTLKSGRVVSQIAELVDLPIATHCPGKWVALDLESGDIWMGTAQGWKRATNEVQREAGAALGVMDRQS